MEFSCSAKQFADHVLVTVAGDVDLAAHSQFQAELDQSWDAAATDLVLDCSQVTFLDSMGLRVLVHAMQRAAAANHTLSLAAPSQPVLRVLELAGVKDLFPVTEP